MNVSILHIEVPRTEGGVVLLPSEARVCLEIDGERSWFTARIEKFYLPDIDAQLIVAGADLVERLRHQPAALHRVTQLVGQVAGDTPVHLPERIAA